MSQTTPTIESTDPNVRLQTVAQLTKIGGVVAISSLVLLLTDGDEAVRDAARKSLDQLDPQWPKTDAAKRAVPRLEAALNDENYWVGLAATTALKLIAGEVADEPKSDKTTLTDRFFYQKREAGRILASALKDTDADFRLVAAETLGHIGNVGFADALASALHDPDEWVRWHAAHSLQATSWETTDEKQKAAWLVILNRWDEAVRLGAVAVEPLLLALKSSRSKTREGAATALGNFKEASVVLPLAECLRDKHKSVRRAAAKVLAAIGAKNLTMEQRNIMVLELKG